jgi:hypothetical protein
MKKMNPPEFPPDCQWVKLSEEFEILGSCRDEFGKSIRLGNITEPLINGQKKYHRIFIRRIKKT